MKKFWECRCRGSLLATSQRDDAGNYACPQCVAAECQLGKYEQVDASRFARLCGLDVSKAAYV